MIILQNKQKNIVYGKKILEGLVDESDLSFFLLEVKSCAFQVMWPDGLSAVQNFHSQCIL